MSLEFLSKQLEARAFSYRAPFLWNGLPTHVRDANSVSTFKSSVGHMIVIWPRSVKVNEKALEPRTFLAVSAWPVPLFLLGFSASNPITGAESLAYWFSFMPSLGGVRHLSGLSH